LRAFLAVALSDEARRGIGGVLERLTRDHSGPRWVRTENLHLTLAFLGGIDESLLPRLDENLAPLVARTPPAELRLEGVGAFPPSRPRVLWLGVSDGATWFVALVREVRDALGAGLGLELDTREPRAHLTLARIERPDRSLVRDLEVAFAGHAFVSRADRLTLFSSVIGRGGPTYNAVTEWGFRG
jgi:2'-5' RNA ligase